TRSAAKAQQQVERVRRERSQGTTPPGLGRLPVMLKQALIGSGGICAASRPPRFACARRISSLQKLLPDRKAGEPPQAPGASPCLPLPVPIPLSSQSTIRNSLRS